MKLWKDVNRCEKVESCREMKKDEEKGRKLKRQKADAKNGKLLITIEKGIKSQKVKKKLNTKVERCRERYKVKEKGIKLKGMVESCREMQKVVEKGRKLKRKV